MFCDNFYLIIVNFSCNSTKKHGLNSSSSDSDVVYRLKSKHHLNSNAFEIVLLTFGKGIFLLVVWNV